MLDFQTKAANCRLQLANYDARNFLHRICIVNHADSWKFRPHSTAGIFRSKNGGIQEVYRCTGRGILMDFFVDDVDSRKREVRQRRRHTPREFGTGNHGSQFQNRRFGISNPSTGLIS